MQQIDTGSRGTWAVNNAGKIYNWNNGWKVVSGSLTHVSSGKSVWGVNKKDDIFRYRGDNKWTRIPGKLVNVSQILNFRLLIIIDICVSLIIITAISLVDNIKIWRI